MRHFVLVVALVGTACGGGGDGGRDASDDDAMAMVDAAPQPDAAPPQFTNCGALPAATGNVVMVTPADSANLPSIVAAAATGTTLLLADGTYLLPGTLYFSTPGVTLRSLSDDAATVILDGQYAVNENLGISASDVTIAHVTITRAVDHPIHITPPLGGPDVTGVLLYGLWLIDGGEQFVKVNPNSDRVAWVDNGRLECSLLRMTDAGRPHVERNPGGCYTGGIDAHSARGWVIRGNRFEDIYCAGEGLAEHAIHFWVGGRDTLVENNVISNCARGVGFGLGDMGNGNTRVYADDPYPGVGYVGHYDGIIRNNVIWADVPWFDTGIALEQARGVRVYHNTVVSTDAVTQFFSSIDYRFPNSVVDVRNNLTRRITLRDGASGTVANNLENTPLGDFVAAGSDFHLVAGATDALDQGVAVPEAGLDIDGDPHQSGAAPDLGADER